MSHYFNVISYNLALNNMMSIFCPLDNDQENHLIFCRFICPSFSPFFFFLQHIQGETLERKKESSLSFSLISFSYLSTHGTPTVAFSNLCCMLSLIYYYLFKFPTNENKDIKKSNNYFEVVTHKGWFITALMRHTYIYMKSLDSKNESL